MDWVSQTVTAMDTADFSSLVGCCPGMCRVDALFLQPGLHVSELHKLTALTRVCLHNMSDSPGSCGESARGLAAVTQLRHLDLRQLSQSFKIASLLPLTSLTSLTRLSFRWRSNDFSERVLSGL